MNNNRPKIASLSEPELAELLINSFFKIGRDINLSGNKLKIFLSEVYKHQGWMFVDTFNDAFSSYAACELPDAEKLSPSLAPRFISKLMKIYLKKCSGHKSPENSEGSTPAALKPEEKFALFMKHLLDYKCIPENPDWVSIYEHLSALNKLHITPKWDTLNYHQKMKIAMLAVSEWAFNNYTVTDSLIYRNNFQDAHLKGIGTRIGETLWSYIG
jgi:hypothetical protein